MGPAGAEIIDLTGADGADALQESNTGPKSSKSASQLSPNIAGPSHLPTVQDAKKVTTRDDPIVISDEEPTADNTGNGRRRRRKRYRSVTVDVPDNAVAGKNSEHVEAKGTSKDAGVVSGDAANKRRKREPSKHDSSKLANGTHDASRREAFPVNHKESLDPQDAESKSRRHERHKLSRRQRREEERNEWDADRPAREQDLHRKDANEAPKSSELFVLDYGVPQPIPQPEQNLSEPSTSKTTLSVINEGDGLILPSHVSTTSPSDEVVQDQPMPANDSDDEDFIRYLDYDDVQRV